jgi:hypothetical protein
MSRRRPPAGGALPLTPELREFLRTGRFPRELYAVPAGLARCEAARELWRQHGAAVTAEWAAEHSGTGPYGFWAFGLDLLPQLGFDWDHSPRQLRYTRRYCCDGYVPSRGTQYRYLRKFGQLHPAEQAASGPPCDTL